MPLDGGTIEA